MNLDHIVNRKPDGPIISQYWYLDSKLHRLNGPAMAYYYSNGSIEAEVWLLYGKVHRLDGPAIVHYYEDGSIELEQWYLYDEELTKEQVEDIKIKLEIEKLTELMLVGEL